MDQMVLTVQEWVNETYANNPNYAQIEENGKTGWPTITALTTALQIELGIPSPNGTFGPTTTNLCPTLSTTSDATNPKTKNIIKILQGALYCKGYNPTGITGTYGNNTKAAITTFQTDAGMPNANGITTPMYFKALLNMDAYVNVGDPKVRIIQQNLNKNYSHVIGLIACDGRYSRTTNKALIYALQIEEGIPEPNGTFGPSTTALLPNLSQGSTLTKFNSILQYSLYVNGFDPNGFDGSFGPGCREAVRRFQAFCMLTVDGNVGKQTWASLLVSTGDKTRKGTAIDCVTTITPARAQTLVSNGYTTVGRYIIGDWKKIKPGELDTIFGAGMKVYPIYQSSGNNLNYFNPTQGAKDAKGALIAANSYGFPSGTIIYFAVDFDALDGDVSTNIIPHFRALFNKMNALGGRYRIGIYGPRNVCSRVAAAGYSISSFVCDMSTGFSGNLGYPLPQDWAFDQISTITIGSGDGLIEIDNNINSGRNPGVSFVGSPIEITTLDDELFKEQYRSTLESQLITLANTHMSAAQILKAVRFREDAVAKVFEYDNLITQLSQTYSMRKAMIQAVLFRELCFEGAEDIGKDAFVRSYYNYKKSYETWDNLPLALKLITPAPTYPIGAVDDCSTGHGQIFASTAIDSNNYAVQSGIISGQIYDAADWNDKGLVWEKLNTDQVYNISTCALVLIRAANLVSLNQIYYEYDATKTKKVITRYNGTGDEAVLYGDETYQYYMVFEQFNKLIREQ